MGGNYTQAQRHLNLLSRPKEASFSKPTRLVRPRALRQYFRRPHATCYIAEQRPGGGGDASRQGPRRKHDNGTMFGSRACQRERRSFATVTRRPGTSLNNRGTMYVIMWVGLTGRTTILSMDRCHLNSHEGGSICGTRQPNLVCFLESSPSSKH